LREGARLAALGCAVGLGASFALTRFIRSALFGVAPTDPAILAIVAVVIVSVGLAAAFLPARRASAIDPMIVLRDV
jgi:ABC-type antimicrobial peptide transport system permease subunit